MLLLVAMVALALPAPPTIAVAEPETTGSSEIDYSRETFDWIPGSVESESVAEHYNLSLDRANALIAWEYANQRDIDSFATRFPSLYGGSEFVREGTGDDMEIEFRVFVTDVAAATSQLELSAPQIDGVATNLVEVANSLSEQAEIERNNLARSPQNHVPSAGRNGNVSFVPYDPQPPESCSPSSVSGGGLESGRRVELAEADNCSELVGCTSGFTAWWGTSGGDYQGLLTAGHCVENRGLADDEDSRADLMYADQTTIYASLRHYSSSFMPEDDVAFLRERYASTDPRGRIHLGLSSEPYRRITARAGSPRPLGHTVCVKSAANDDVDDGADHAAGFMCGEVVDEMDFWRPTSGPDSVANRWTRVEMFDDEPTGGASGAPWFFGRTAYGVHTGGSSAEWYERIEEALEGLESKHGGNARLYCRDSAGDDYLCG